jgi:hypothetical protein
MTGKKSAAPSLESIARANRQRLAHEEGLRAMADAERDAAAVRKNMERLRALRQAKEAEAQQGDPAPIAAAARKRKKPVSK